MVLVKWGKYGAVLLTIAEVALASLIQGVRTQMERRSIPYVSNQQGLNVCDIPRSSLQ